MKTQQGLPCPECSKLAKQIKVISADYQFELRKLAEDHSTDKALYEIATQKEIRKWQEKYNREKYDREEDSKKWLNKFECTEKQYRQKENEIIKNQQKSISDAQTYAKQQIEIHQANTNQLIQEKQNELENHQKIEIEKINKHFENKIILIESNYTNEIANLKKNYETEKSKMKLDYESTIIGLQSQKNSEEIAHKKTQEESKKERTRLYTEIYEIKTKINEKNTKISELQSIISQNREEIQRQKIETAELIEENRIKTEKMLKSHHLALDECEFRSEEKIKEFYHNELKLTEKYEKIIEKIEQKRQNQVKIYEYNMKEIKNCIQNRPSRLQDIEQILLLKEKLFKIQKERDCIQKELKFYQLELENKEDTYNKLFIPNVNSGYVFQGKKKEQKLKRAGRSVTTVREILHSVNSNNLPMLNNIQKRYLPPKSNKIL